MLEWLEAHQISCLFKETFGTDCPGCGLQRALLLLVKGELWASVCIWPGVIPLLIFLLLILVRICGVKKISDGMLKKVGFVCLIIILISYLLKLIVKTY